MMPKNRSAAGVWVPIFVRIYCKISTANQLQILVQFCITPVPTLNAGIFLTGPNMATEKGITQTLQRNMIADTYMTKSGNPTTSNMVIR